MTSALNRPRLPSSHSRSEILGGTSCCTISVEGGVLFAKTTWTTLPSTDDLAAHGRHCGAFSPRPFRLGQPPDPSGLACTIALTLRCCRHFQLLWTPALAALLETDPRMRDWDAAEQIAESESFETPQEWSHAVVQQLLIHILAHGSADLAKELAVALGLTLDPTTIPAAP
jgi:hypothetical protein